MLFRSGQAFGFKVMASAPGTLGGEFSNALMQVSPEASARVGGAGQMLLGITGMAGTAATAATTGCGGVLGCPALGMLAGVSVDQAAMGFDTIVYGATRDSAISQGAQYLGASPESASIIDVVASGGAGLRVTASQMGAGAVTVLKNQTALTASLDEVPLPAGSVAHVNPTGSAYNCTQCALSVDRQLTTGVKTTANSMSQPLPFSKLNGLYNTKFSSWTSRAEIERNLLSSGNGTTAVIYGMDRAGTSGHVWNAVVQKNRINYIDGQLGRGGAVNFDDFPLLRFGITSGAVK